jgi:hypothetical protein
VLCWAAFPWSLPFAPPTPLRIARFVRRLPSYYGRVRLLASVRSQQLISSRPHRTERRPPLPVGLCRQGAFCLRFRVRSPVRGGWFPASSTPGHAQPCPLHPRQCVVTSERIRTTARSTRAIPGSELWQTRVFWKVASSVQGQRAEPEGGECDHSGRDPGWVGFADDAGHQDAGVILRMPGVILAGHGRGARADL